MLDLRYFQDRRFSVASGGMTLIFFAMFGTFFLVAQYFQLVLGYSPLESGLFQLPMAFVMMGLSPQVPKLVARFGVAPGGARRACSSVAIGLVLFSFMGVDTTIWWVYGPILLPGRRHGPHHDAAHHADHVGGARSARPASARP